MSKKIAIDLNDVVRAYTDKFKQVYCKAFDCDKKPDEIIVDNSDLQQFFEFEGKVEYQQFVYEDYAFELYGSAEPCDKNLQYRLHNWLGNDLRNLEDEDGESIEPEVMFVSPFEIGATIQASMFFLYKLSSRVREYYFPKNSLTIWDKADIVVTASPWLIEHKPEGKVAIKIETSYNKEVEADYTFSSFMDLMNNGKKIIEKIILS